MSIRSVVSPQVTFGLKLVTALGSVLPLVTTIIAVRDMHQIPRIIRAYTNDPIVLLGLTYGSAYSAVGDNHVAWVTCALVAFIIVAIHEDDHHRK